MTRNIPVAMSVESIQEAIQYLTEYREELNERVGQVIETLANEGADVARGSYAGWNVTVSTNTEGQTSDIVVSGVMPMIAEFGAGDATLSGGFSNTPAAARPGSYSETHAQQYSRFGVWHFGGRAFTEVQPHHGLLDAKTYIMSNSTPVAQEVFG